MPGSRRCRWPCRRLKMCLKSLGLLWVLWSEDLTPHMHTLRLPAASVRLLMGPPLAGFQDACDKCNERSGNELGHTFSAPSSFFFFTPTASHTRRLPWPQTLHISHVCYFLSSPWCACHLLVLYLWKVSANWDVWRQMVITLPLSHKCTYLSNLHKGVKPHSRLSFRPTVSEICMFLSCLDRAVQAILFFFLASHSNSHLNKRIIFRKWWKLIACFWLWKLITIIVRSVEGYFVHAYTILLAELW